MPPIYIMPKFNRYYVDPTYPLCGNGTKDMIHFLLKCRSLLETRVQFMDINWWIKEQKKSLKTLTY